MSRTVGIQWCLTFLVAGHAAAADRLDGADEFVRAAMKHWETPGAAVVVVKDSEAETCQEQQDVWW